MIEGTSQVGKLALFILVIFIELISAHKSAKREREREKRELGQHPALGQWCVSSVAFALEFLNARKFIKHHIYHTAHLCTLLNFYRKNLSEDKNFGRSIYHKCSGQNKEEKKSSAPPRRGIEPRSPAWQAGILTTILPRTRLRKIGKFKLLIKIQAGTQSTISRRPFLWLKKKGLII